ncbi:MAG: DUF1553 domain-containing protein [Planctomycetota bacterium]
MTDSIKTPFFFVGALFSLLVFVLPAAICNAQDEALTDEQVTFFETKIRPVLVRECYSCHSAQTGQSRGGLQVDTRDGFLVGGDSGPAFEPGEAEGSILMSALEYDEWAMPPSKQLSANVIEDFRTWIEMGAPDPRIITRAERDYGAATVTADDIREAKTQWAYSQPVQVPPPAVQNSAWTRSPIDNFVLAELEQEAISPATDAEPYDLVRRLSYDLTGLPPSQDQVDWFLNAYESDPDRAVAIVVDGLLKSERFGERWARHWLDVARYAESTGREVNATFPHAWRYRDYVIDAFNNDKPYDEFIREQIAGDLLPAEDDETWAEHLVATGFLAMGPKSLNEQNARQFILDQVDEQIDVSTRVILGISVACARCHDHKFDPVPQEDYYAMAGIFLSTSTHYGTIDSQQNRRPSNLLRLPDEDPDPYLKQMTSAEIRELRQEFDEVRESAANAARERRLEQRRGADTRTVNQLRQQENRLGAQAAILEQIVNSYDQDGNPLSFVMAVQDRDQAINARLLVRGELDQPSDEIDRGVVQVIGDRQRIRGDRNSGRKELAEWMTDEENPLTARVMVNRVWKHLFGNGIVRTTENFGSTGEPPTHPELLDYLAVEFMEHDWSVKELIRAICTSHVYRQSTAFNENAFERDPENRLLWRRTPSRLDAEAMRDSMLFASGQIEMERPRGSIVTRAGQTIVRDGNLSSGIEVFQLLRESGSETMDVREAFRQRARQQGAAGMRQLRDRLQFEIDDSSLNYRSVYLPVIRDNIPIALEAFDFAEPTMVVGVRGSTNSPSQALFMMNDEFVIRQSNEMAKAILFENHNLNDRLNAVMRRIYSRDATESELEAMTRFYNTVDSQVTNSRQRTPEREKISAICQAVFASADFRFLN